MIRSSYRKTPLLFHRGFSTLSELFLTKHSNAPATPKHDPPVKIISYYIAVPKLKSEPNPDKILPIFDSISGNSNTSVARRFRELAVKRLTRERNFPAIETLVEKQMRNCKTPDEKFLAKMILTYGKAGLVEHAIRTFDRVRELLGSPPTVLSFNALLNACNTARKFDQVPELFYDFPKNFGISPNKISYGIYVRSLCELGLIESAHLVLDEMEKNNIEITDVTYSTILNGCYKNNMLELADKIWAEMGEKGASPGVGSYTSKLLYHATKGNIELVSMLMDEMAAVGVKPDVITYRLLMAYYYNNDLIEEALKVCKDMESNGLSLDGSTFSYIVLFLCKKGKYTLGLFVWKQCAQRNMRLNIATLRCLIQGLAKDLKLQRSEGLVLDAKELLRKAKWKYPKYLLNELEELERSFSVVGIEGSVAEKEEMGI